MSIINAVSAREARVSYAGSCALLLDAGGNKFCLPTQQRLGALIASDSPLRAQSWVREYVLGVNSLLLIFDALAVDHIEAQAQLLQLWNASQPRDVVGVAHQVTVNYDLSDQSDLAAIATHAGLARQEIMQLHSGAEYRVACVGSMPGFAYLTGLPDQLATPRRARPRASMPKGAVIVGGTQAGIMPCTAPSGWHMLGSTAIGIFDPHRSHPCLFAAGDRVVFQIGEVYT